MRTKFADAAQHADAFFVTCAISTVDQYWQSRSTGYSDNSQVFRFGDRLGYSLTANK